MVKKGRLSGFTVKLMVGARSAFERAGFTRGIAFVSDGHNAVGGEPAGGAGLDFAREAREGRGARNRARRLRAGHRRGDGFCGSEGVDTVIIMEIDLFHDNYRYHEKHGFHTRETFEGAGHRSGLPVGVGGCQGSQREQRRNPGAGDPEARGTGSAVEGCRKTMGS